MKYGRFWLHLYIGKPKPFFFTIDSNSHCCNCCQTSTSPTKWQLLIIHIAVECWIQPWRMIQYLLNNQIKKITVLLGKLSKGFMLLSNLGPMLSWSYVIWTHECYSFTALLLQLRKQKLSAKLNGILCSEYARPRRRMIFQPGGH